MHCLIRPLTSSSFSRTIDGGLRHTRAPCDAASNASLSEKSTFCRLSGQRERKHFVHNRQRVKRGLMRVARSAHAMQAGEVLMLGELQRTCNGA